MNIIEAPALLPNNIDLFLAGGISNCPDWQTEAIALLSNTAGVVANPRRTEYSWASVAEEQIFWEYQAIKASKVVLFWFPAETLCPITLYELGVLSQRVDVPIFVGTHPSYGRRLDVMVQLQLARPEVVLHDSLDKVIRDYLG